MCDISGFYGVYFYQVYISDFMSVLRWSIACNLVNSWSYNYLSHSFPWRLKRPPRIVPERESHPPHQERPLMPHSFLSWNYDICILMLILFWVWAVTESLSVSCLPHQRSRFWNRSLEVSQVSLIKMSAVLRKLKKSCYLQPFLAFQFFLCNKVRKKQRPAWHCGHAGIKILTTDCVF